MYSAGVATLFAVVVAGLTTVAEPATADPARTTDTFCADLQRSLTSTTVAVTTVVHPDFDSFKASKPEVRPLRTEQFVTYEDAEKRHPMRISCKLKSPDIILKEYGPGTATDGPAACSDVHRQIVASTLAIITPAEKAQLRFDPTKIVFDPDDQSMTGERWLAPFAFAYADAKGALHLRGKLLRADWNNKLFALMPDRMRGTLYCHLVAPEYARRLLTGEATAPSE